MRYLTRLNFRVTRPICKLSLGALFLAGLLLSSGQAQEISPGPPEQTLQELKDGNSRFVAGKSTFQHESKSWREKLSSAQHPKAIILGCADSRVPPELLFDQGFGDLFVIRIAGNVVDMDVAASLDYAFLHTGARLVVVLGHQDCGAVTAALGDYRSEVLPIQSLLKQIVPALLNIPLGAPLAERVNQGVYANVRQSVRELKSMATCAAAMARHDLIIIGAVYDLESGQVDFLEP